MKFLTIILGCLILQLLGQAVDTLIVHPDGTLARPTNFWNANSNAIKAFVTGGVSISSKLDANGGNGTNLTTATVPTATNSIVNKAYSDSGDALALPKTGGTMTGTLVFSGSQPTATTSAPNIVQLNSATNSTSTTTAATPAALKLVYDAAIAASGGGGGGGGSTNYVATTNGVAVSLSTPTTPTASTNVVNKAYADAGDATANAAAAAAQTTANAAAVKANNLSDLANAGTARSNLGLATVAASGSAGDLGSGTLPAARLPNPGASSLGGVQSKASVSSQFLTQISTSGVVSSAQPAASDITGLATSATTDTTAAGNISSGTLSAARLPALTGDATTSAGSAAVTVVKINGTSLAGLGTGIVKNTTGTGVPSIAIAADFPTLNQSTTGSAANLTTARTIAATGDITYTSPTFDGSANVTAAATIATGVVTDAKGALTVKPSCAVVAVANLTLSGEQTIDGTATSGSLVLATAQSTASQNGPWVTAAGAWARPTWFASGSTTQAPVFCSTFIRLGTTYQGSVWRMTTTSVTIDTTSETWTQVPYVLGSSSVAGTLPAAQLPARTGDATASAGSASTTVVAINGTTLSGLATGLLKNTTGTGVPSIATASTDYLPGGAQTVALNMGTHLINNVTDPASPQDAVTRNYFQSNPAQDPQMAIMAAYGSQIVGQSFSSPTISSATSMVNTRAYMDTVFISKPITLNGIAVNVTAIQSLLVTNNYSGVYLTTYSGGTYTVVASSINTAAFANATGVQKTAFSSTYAAAAGVYQVWIVASWATITTAPTLATAATTTSLANTADFSNSAVMFGFKTATTLPTTVAASGMTAGVARIWFGLY